MSPIRPRRPAVPPPAPEGEALWLRPGRRGPEPYTQALGEPPSVRGERVRSRDDREFRHWDPTRSKLAAAIVLGWTGSLPRPGERWLYLGAGSGTTASHVADLVGPTGAVYAVEPSVRPFLALLAVAERYPNLFPILGDARHPESYAGSVPPVEGLYCDVAQPDQPEIVTANAETLLRPSAPVLFVVKTSSLGRDPRAERLLDRAIDRLGPTLRVRESTALEPFHRRHFLVDAGYGLPTAVEAPPSRGRPAAPSSRASRGRGRR